MNSIKLKRLFSKAILIDSLKSISTESIIINPFLKFTLTNELLNIF